ncbi:Protein T05B9.2 [Aphelenchoides avenae]|nr:Protein T05B9.2 [Aphelenchus avenae]
MPSTQHCIRASSEHVVEEEASCSSIPASVVNADRADVRNRSSEEKHRSEFPCPAARSSKGNLTPRQSLSTTLSSLSALHIIATLFSTTVAMPLAVQQRSARCYAFTPGTTIAGADYRRDYGLTMKECSETCKNDACCMAFEWSEDECTLRSRSLNGTVETKKGATFGLCLDYDDEERDRFWDHELGGTVVATKPEVARDECADYCASQQGSIAYSWRTYDETDVDAKDGHCECIEVLHHIRLSFGSFAGFLI